jgi:hypothetical protein
MIQFYLLSIVCNVIAGLYLFLSSDEQEGKEKEDKTAVKSPQIVLPGFMSVFSNKMAKFWLGSAAIIIGIFKMLSPVRSTIVILGDLLPLLSCLIVGVVFIIDFFKTSSDVNSDTINKLDIIVLKNRKYIGMFSLLTAFLHFIVPDLLIL